MAVVPADGPTGLPEHVEIDLAERAATLFDEKLGDVDRARPYLERMLARQPGNERAFQRLKQILTTREQWGELEALYERVVAATAEPARRAELLAEVALVAEEITGDRPKAIGYYERILELDSVHEQAIRSLDSLYAAEQRWDRLAQLLERRLQAAAGDEKLDLEQRLGTLLVRAHRRRLGALSYLEQVLRERPSAAEARQLVEKILDVPELRSRAAIVLEAVYAERDEVPELVRVLEIHLEFASAARRAARPACAGWPSSATSGCATTRAPSRPSRGCCRSTRTTPGRASACSRSRGGWARTSGRRACSRRRRQPRAAPLPRAEILMDLARLYEGQLDDSARAEAVYRQVLQLAPDDAAIALPACRSLERIYAAAATAGSSADILRIEVKLEDDAGARRELRGRLGELCETVLDDPRGGHRGVARPARRRPGRRAGAFGARPAATSGRRAGASSSRSFARASA